MSVTLRRRSLADLPDLWRWMYGTPDAEWRQWDAPYLHSDLPELSYSDYAAAAVLGLHSPDPDLRVIDIGGEARGIVTRHWDAPEAGGWLEAGIVIYDPRYWNGGHGTAALRLWTQCCFAETPAHLVTLTTWSGNARMIGAGLKCGYRECARIPEARLWQGKRFDSVRLALLRHEYRP